ncbi:MAG: hypothetical protein IPG02_15570 [Ignavibacteria bacterium]|nr:hypothetical protein [Ignavibacteria bacterium]
MAASCTVDVLSFTLDGDWASNMQLAMGSRCNSSKKYYANQENINKFTNTDQTNTYLDKHEAIENMELPTILAYPKVSALDYICLQPNERTSDWITFPPSIHNYYNIDPL